MNYLKVIQVGRVGRDAEMRYTPSGQAVTSFSVATSDKYKNAAGEDVKKTIWVRVSVWGKLAETCNQYVKKGMEVLVEGRLVAGEDGNPRTYESNGATKASFEINATSVQFGAGGENKPAANPIDEDDVQF